jgi:hypothetical protein
VELPLERGPRPGPEGGVGEVTQNGRRPHHSALRNLRRLDGPLLPAHALATAELGITRINKLYKAAAKRADHYRIDMLEVLPPHVQRKLKKLVPTLHGRSFGNPFGGPNEYASAVTHLRIAAGAVPDLEVEALLLSERRANPLGFVKTLAAWNSERKLPFLATMVVDENPTVRAQAGFSLIEHAHQYPADRDRAYAVVRSAVMQEDGCALLDGLAGYPTEEIADLEELLRSHRSAALRARFVNDD